MNSRSYIAFIALLCFCIQGMAQNVTGQVSADDVQVSDLLQSNTALQAQVFGSQSVQQQSTSLLNNNVFIQQIGDDNVINTRIDTNLNTSSLRLTQAGNSNIIVIDEKAPEVVKNIVQNGDNNKVIDFSLNSLNATSLDLIQNGSNLTFEKFGTNSLTENLKFTMQGTSRTLIIRSF